MRRILPAGYEDDSDEDEEFIGLPTSSTIKAQQTWLLSDKGRNSSSKDKRRKDYVAARAKDKKLGEVCRPQDQPQNKPYFVDAVRRNLGLGIQPKSDATPSQFQLPIRTPGVDVMDPKCSRTPKWIESAGRVEEVQKQLDQHEEIAIDFENNNEHSYLGMTALVQISTVNNDYIFDPFPTFPTLKPMLLSIMTDPKKLKIFCGAGNDFLNLRRDFELVSALCVDIQFLDKRINGLSVTSNPKGLKQLCEIYLNVSIPKGETNRDWRRRPLPPDMIGYAQGDTYYTMAVYQEMKKRIYSQTKQNLLLEAIEDTMAMMTSVLQKTNTMQSVTEFNSSDSTIKDLLNKWRVDIGKLVDDKPKNVLSDQSLLQLANQSPSDYETIKKIIGHHAGLIKGNIFGLCRLLKEKTDFWTSTECNKCGVLGHCAMQCILPTNRSVEKERYKKNPELKRKQNQRRRRNKARNAAMRENIN